MTQAPETEKLPRLERSKRGSAEQIFRAVVDERLSNLEDQLREVKTRVNGLLFFLAGTVVAQVVLQVMA